MNECDDIESLNFRQYLYLLSKNYKNKNDKIDFFLEIPKIFLNNPEFTNEINFVNDHINNLRRFAIKYFNRKNKKITNFNLHYSDIRDILYSILDFEYYKKLNINEITHNRNVNLQNINELIFYYSTIIDIINLTITFLQSDNNVSLEKLNIIKKDIDNLESKKNLNNSENMILSINKNLYYIMRNIYKLIYGVNV